MASVTRIETHTAIWSVFGASPDPRILDRLPIGEWHRLGAVPIATGASAIRIAATQPLTEEDIEFLERTLRGTVEVVICGHTALDIAFASHEADPAVRAQIYWRYLAAKLTASGFDAVPTAAPVSDLFRPTVQEFQQGLSLTTDVALRALGLLANLTVLPEAELGGPKPLLAMTPVEQRQEWRAVPLRRIGNAILWCSDAAVSERAQFTLQNAFGLPAYVTLIETETLDAFLTYEETTSEKLRDDVIVRNLLDLGAISDEQYRATQLMARSRLTSESDALREITQIPSAAMARATAQAWGTDWIGPTLPMNHDVHRFLPYEAAARLHVWPVNFRGRVLTVATPRSGDEQFLEAVADITGQPIRAVYAAPEQLDAALATEWSFRLPPEAIDDVVPLETEFDAQEYAFLTQELWLDLDKIHLPAQSQAALDANVPIVYEDGILAWGAVGETGSFDQLAHLSTALGRPVRPVVSTVAEVRTLLRQAQAERAVPEDQRPTSEALALLDELRRHGWLTEGQRRTFLDDPRWKTQPDEALSLATGVEASEAAQRLAEVVGWPLIDLRPQTVYIDMIDPVGVPYRGKRVEEPMDMTLARSLGEADARRLRALPIVFAGGRVTVALATPFTPEVMPELRRLLGSDVIPTLAVSSDVTAAMRRVHRRPTLGEALIETGIIDVRDLEDALRTQKKSGGRIGAVLQSSDLVSQTDIAGALAAQYNLPYFDLANADIDPETVRAIPEEIARTEQVLPVLLTPQTALVGVVAPGNLVGITRAAEYLDRDVETVVVTPDDLEEALERAYRFDYLNTSAFDLMSRTPENSASRVLTQSQKVFFIVVLVVIAICLLFNWIGTLSVLISLCTLFYTFFSAYRIYLIQRALSSRLEIPVTQEEIDALDDRTLPVYSILTPLYKEKEVLPILVESIRRLDYPKVKLDVLILLEEDDEETVLAARAMNLPSHFRIIVVPNGNPKGKPKALNYGLLHARGEYVVIYDAEDTPDVQQLKHAVVIFNKTDESLCCIQGKLNYYNRDQNLLTQWFTIEYSMWFDLLLPGLNATDAPIPLGGTSNHFRVRQLQELGAWDPYNVTEDADLGVRLYKAGYSTAVMDSTTYEEANSQFFNWINQRSRWVKGYIQSYLVHMRHPVALWRALGPKAFLSFQLIVGGTFFGFLINPVFWLLTTLWFTLHLHFIEVVFPTAIFYIASLGLYLGNFSFTYINVAGCLRRRYYHLVKYALLSPIYWGMMSIAAWKGFLQLFYKPFYWEKTKHGLTNVAPSTRGADE